jgi:four helix bundle protein
MKLEKFGALIKANELFDCVVVDLEPLKSKFECERLIKQQYASADSIAANIEEGYGRGSRKDYRHFLIIARGSAQETRGRYGRLKHWLQPEIVLKRQALCDQIIAILSKTINTLN